METQLLIPNVLGYGEQDLICSALDLLTEEEKMLTAFSAFLRKT